MINMKKYDEVKIYKHIADRKNINQEVVVIDEHIDVEVDEFVTVEAFDYVNEKRVQIMFEIEAFHKKYRTKKDSGKTEEKEVTVDDAIESEVDDNEIELEEKDEKNMYTLAGVVDNKLIEEHALKNEYVIFSNEDVSESVYTGSNVIYFTDCNNNNDIVATEKLLESLNSKLDTLIVDVDFDYITTLVSNATRIALVDYNDLEFLEEKRDLLVYDLHDNRFYNLLDYEVVKSVEIWDGSNFKNVMLDLITEVELSDDYVSLDECGNDNLFFWTNKQHEHHDVYKVITLDKEEQHDLYAIIINTDLFGVYDYCKIVDGDGLKNHLEYVNRDVDEYITLIEKNWEG